MNRRRVLIAVPISRDPYERGGGANLYFANIGLAYIGAYLREQGHEVQLFDGVIQPSFEELGAVLDAFQPDHVGLTAFTVNVKAAHATAAWIKERHPGITITLGGSHAIGAARESIEEFPHFDYAIGDEGELSYGRLIASDGDPADLATIPALAWRRDGEAVLNPRGDYPEFDDLPVPAWDLFDLDHYQLLPFRPERREGQHELQVLTARGCPFRCTYCSHASGFKVRKRSVEKVIEELRTLIHRYEARAVYFATETFTLDRAYTVELLTRMIEEGFPEHLYWGCSTRVDTLDPELIRLMRKSGCSYVSMGLESGTQDVLDSVERGHKVVNVQAIIDEMRREDISVHSNFLIGLPGETIQTIRQSIAMALRSNIDYASFCIFVPYPGSALTASLEHGERYRIRTKDWDLYRNQAGLYLIDNPELSERTVRRMHMWAYFRFYVRFGYWVRLVKLVNPRMIAYYAFDSLRRGLRGGTRPSAPAAQLAPGT